MLEERSRRKEEHLAAVRRLPDGPRSPGWEDIQLLPCCLPELAWDEVDLSTRLGGHELASPFLINAITGGSPQGLELNATLGRLARELGLAMAVGSQTAALRDSALEESFRVARRENPEGVILANLSAGATLEEARRAVAMLNADILQLHLNAAQELAMPEGERDFRGWSEHIRSIASGLAVPLAVKEVGFGMAAEEAERLAGLGVRMVDVGGAGGTNFVAVEAARRGASAGDSLLNWGLPAAVSLLEVLDAVGEQVEVVASGGIRDGVAAGKALAAGACAVGVAGPLVRALARGGAQEARRYLVGLMEELRTVMVLTGSRSLWDLRQRPFLVLGDTAEALRRRGVDLDRYARRGSI